jgi:hypothetical protein
MRTIKFFALLKRGVSTPFLHKLISATFTVLSWHKLTVFCVPVFGLVSCAFSSVPIKKSHFNSRIFLSLLVFNRIHVYEYIIFSLPT